MSTTPTKKPSRRVAAWSAEGILDRRLPAGWRLRIEAEMPSSRNRMILGGAIISPDDERVAVVMEAHSWLDPRHVKEAAEQIQALVDSDTPAAIPIITAPFLSPRSRKMLHDYGVGCVDVTGNIHIEVPKPGLHVSVPGTDRNPWPKESELQSLRGRGAARSVRAIIDSTPPFGVRDLAAARDVSAASLSRVLALLEREGLVRRTTKGQVSDVDWKGSIERWAEDYDQITSNTATAYLWPRGMAPMAGCLATAGIAYVATGAYAAQKFSPIAPTKIVTLYVENPVLTVNRLGLREVDAGANVVLLEPFDSVVFERAATRDGLRCVAPSQLAVDLLTGPGREPTQGEELLRWMKGNEPAWRSRPEA